MHAERAVQEHAARFASMVAAFCERLGWYDLEALIAKFQAGAGLGHTGCWGETEQGPIGAIEPPLNRVCPTA